jgi:hypothetical protein
VILLAAAAFAGCAPAPVTTVAAQICGRLSERDCEGYVAAAQASMGGSPGPLKQIVADSGCPIEGSCNPPVDAWVALLYWDSPPIIAVMRGDPSGPPAVTGWTGPLPRLP